MKGGKEEIQASPRLLSRPEKEHDRGSRPRPSPGPPSGRSRCDADGGVAQVGEIALVGGARLLAGAASCWRGFLLMTGGTGASRRGENKAAVTVHGRTHDDPWRAATPSQTLSSRRETLSISPEDDLRPPMRERTCFRRLGEPRARASLPSQGRTRGVFPFTGENLVPEVGREPRARASLPSQGRTRGVLRRGESAIPPSVDQSSR